MCPPEVRVLPAQPKIIYYILYDVSRDPRRLVVGRLLLRARALVGGSSHCGRIKIQIHKRSSRRQRAPPHTTGRACELQLVGKYQHHRSIRLGDRWSINIPVGPSNTLDCNHLHGPRQLGSSLGTRVESEAPQNRDIAATEWPAHFSITSRGTPL